MRAKISTEKVLAIIVIILTITALILMYLCFTMEKP